MLICKLRYDSGILFNKSRLEQRANKAPFGHDGVSREGKPSFNSDPPPLFDVDGVDGQISQKRDRRKSS